jgi:TIR domain/Restriction endonuclease
MDEKPTSQTGTPCVYLCCASKDLARATAIADALRAQVKLRVGIWEVAASSSVITRIRQSTAANDRVVVLLSQASLSSRWVKSELNACRLTAALQDVTVIPALIDDCIAPLPLPPTDCVDMRTDLAGAIDALRRRLHSDAEPDFSALKAPAFKEAVAALFRKLDCAVQPRALISESDIDFLVSTHAHASSAGEQTTMWLVTARYCDNERISISETMEMFYGLMTTPGARRGLVVTNGRLTPIAWGYANECGNRPGRDIQVIDGSRLVRLLSPHRDIVQRYFHRSVKHD